MSVLLFKLHALYVKISSIEPFYYTVPALRTFICTIIIFSLAIKINRKIKGEIAEKYYILL